MTFMHEEAGRNEELIVTPVQLSLVTDSISSVGYGGLVCLPDSFQFHNDTW